MLCRFPSSILLTDFDLVPHIHLLEAAFVHHVQFFVDALLLSLQHFMD
jgi:hypothetical protein